METKIILENLYKFKKTWKIKKAKKIVKLMNEVINSNSFEKELLAFKFSDTRFRHDNEFQEIKSNKEIHQILKKGFEQNSADGNDYIWKLNIKLGRRLPQVGRRVGNLIITQNWFFKRDKNHSKVASHWFHEYSHVLGFHHDYEETERRPNSVPYGLNQIVEKVLENKI